MYIVSISSGYQFKLETTAPGTNEGKWNSGDSKTGSTFGGGATQDKWFWNPLDSTIVLVELGFEYDKADYKKPVLVLSGVKSLPLQAGHKGTGWQKPRNVERLRQDIEWECTNVR